MVGTGRCFDGGGIAGSNADGTCVEDGENLPAVAGLGALQNQVQGTQQQIAAMQQQLQLQQQLQRQQQPLQQQWQQHKQQMNVLQQIQQQ